MSIKDTITKVNREEELKKNPILALFDVIKGISETKDLLQSIFDRKVEPPVVNVEAPVVNIPAPIVNVPAPIVNVPEQVAPIVNVPSPIVNIEAPIINVPEQPAPIVNVNTKKFEQGIDTTNKTLKDIFDDLKARGLDVGKVQLVDKDGKPIDLTRIYSSNGLIGGRGYETVWVKNVAGDKLNVATSENQATQILHTTDQTATGTLAVLNDAVELTLNAKANTVFQIVYSAFVGKIMFEAQVDGGWSPVYGFLAGTGQSKTEYANPASGNIFRCSSAGFKKIRVRLSLATSGSATIYAIATNVTSGVFINFPLPEGGNNIGIVGIVDESEVRMTPAKETGGNLASILTVLNDKLADYKISDIDADASPNYYGYIRKDGAYYILKETVSAGADTYRYAKGASGYTTAWTNRASQTYNYFDTEF